MDKNNKVVGTSKVAAKKVSVTLYHPYNFIASYNSILTHWLQVQDQTSGIVSYLSSNSVCPVSSVSTTATRNNKTI